MTNLEKHIEVINGKQYIPFEVAVKAIGEIYEGLGQITDLIDKSAKDITNTIKDIDLD
tara:strand:- start:1528 stop:1701 length:174 start_codon:yes stop_codon:yes gene_type:complete